MPRLDWEGCWNVRDLGGLPAAGGRLVRGDRTGLVTALLPALLGTPPGAIAADYALSSERLAARAVALGEPDPGPELASWLKQVSTSVAELLAALTARDLAGALEAGGLRSADLAALRRRALAPVGRTDQEA